MGADCAWSAASAARCTLDAASLDYLQTSLQGIYIVLGVALAVVALMGVATVWRRL